MEITEKDNNLLCSISELNRYNVIKRSDYDYLRKSCRFPTHKEYVQKMVSNWRRRLHMESFNSTPYFVTLTFEDAPNLDYEKLKDQLQKFLKRFRWWLSLDYPAITLKYYLVSEKGDKFGRWHYHACFYLNKPLTLQTVRNLVDKAWKVGRTQVKSLDARTINYVTKYIFKRYQRGCHELVISLKSNGIGMSFCDRSFIGRQKKRFTRYCFLNGRKLFLPRYLWLKIYPDEKRIGKNTIIFYPENRSIREQIAEKDKVLQPYFMVKKPPKSNFYNRILEPNGSLSRPSNNDEFLRIYTILNQ